MSMRTNASARHHGRRLLLAASLTGALVLATPSAAAAAGELDPSFGAGGTVVTNIGGPDSPDGANDILVLPNDKIVAAGHTGSQVGDSDFALVRYLPDGSVDPTFGAGGTVVTDVSGTGAPDSANAVIRQPDGKLVVGGITGSRSDCRFALARYLPSGSLDPTFGGDGIVITDLVSTTYGGARDLALQENGRIVAVGSVIANPGIRFAVARYRPNGTLDPTFGTGGTVVTAIANYVPSPLEYANTVAVQSDGRIVVGGAAGQVYRPSHVGLDFALVRYTASGALDPTFGSGGKVVNYLGGMSLIEELAIRGDGKIVAAGYANGAWAHNEYGNVAVARYRKSGALHSTFGTGGVVHTDVSKPGMDAATDLVLRADGGVLVAGYTRTTEGPRFLLAKYRPAGALDPAFGSGGTIVTDLNGPITHDYGQAIAVQPDGRIVVGGNSWYSYEDDFALARYLP